MDPAFALQVIAIAIGGGTVQFVIFLLRRKSELRKLDVESDSTLLNSANAYIGTLQTGEKALRLEVAELKIELRVMKEERTQEKLDWVKEREILRKEWDREREANTDALEASTREVSRFRMQLIQLKSDLASAQDQIADLTRKIGGAAT
jgi:chromosome segregation ATPase